MINSIDLPKSQARQLSKFVLATEEYVKNLGPDLYPGTSSNSLTGRFFDYNYLNDLPGTILLPILKPLFGPCVVLCWANTLRKGEGIKEHDHGVPRGPIPSRSTSAHIFLSGTRTGTFFRENDGSFTKHENVPGRLTYFPSHLRHYVPANPRKSIRVSLAMDIYPKRWWDIECSRYYYGKEDSFYFID